MLIDIPLVRASPWYPGQIGVFGSDVPRGFRRGTQGITLFVDPSHPDASDAHDGTDPEHPKRTIQSAVSSPFLVAGSVIVLAPGDYAESVVTADYGVAPSYVTIYGQDPFQYGVYWESDLATSPCLSLNAPGWRILNIRFAAPTQAACIELHHTDVSGLDIAINTIIQDCHFYGQTTGRYGIASHGCYEVWIKNCVFENFHNAVAGGARCIVTLPCPLAIPFRNHIEDCKFYESDNGIDGEFNASFFLRNMFASVGIGYSMTIICRTNGGVGGGGNDNIVAGNVFPGDYSIVGGYRGAATDTWIGNWTPDVAEAEVGPDGISIAVPT